MRPFCDSATHRPDTRTTAGFVWTFAFLGTETAGKPFRFCLRVDVALVFVMIRDNATDERVGFRRIRPQHIVFSLTHLKRSATRVEWTLFSLNHF